MKFYIALIALLALLGCGEYTALECQANLSECMEQASNGDMEAQYLLVDVYGNGRGVPKDETEATRWLQQAADQGHPRAQYGLGVLFTAGRIVGQQEAEARRWYRLAAEQGDADAQAALGDSYMFPRPGAERDYAEAARWLLLAANQGHSGA